MRMCQCEHSEHSRSGRRDADGNLVGVPAPSARAAGHSYLGVAAGGRTAQYVGPICDACADEHLRDYVMPALGEPGTRQELPAIRSELCQRCGHVGRHGYVHVRHGNGGGHNELCPEARGGQLDDEAEREAGVAAFAATLREDPGGELLVERSAAARVLAESLYLLPAALRELGIGGKLCDAAHDLARAVDRAADALDNMAR